MVLNRDAILENRDLETKEVEVPEWGGSVLIRTWTGADRDQYDLAVAKAREDGNQVPENVRALTVAISVVDEDGNRIFKDKDVELIGRKSGKALDRIFTEALKLNLVSAAAVEELSGN